MKHKQFQISIILILGLGVAGLQAQESVNTTGENIFGSGGSASYSVGQVAYSTCTNIIGSAVEGVQQPFEIFIVTAIKDAINVNLSFIVYPNPTLDYLTLDVGNFDLSNLKCIMYDNNGKLLQSQIITSNKTNINVKNLLPGLYYVTVIFETKVFKTFKIIKK